MTIQVVNHPVLLHKLSLLRDVRTKSKQFRDLVYEVTLLLGMQATQTLDLIQTTRQVSPLPYGVQSIKKNALMMHSAHSWRALLDRSKESGSRTPLPFSPSCGLETAWSMGSCISSQRLACTTSGSTVKSPRSFPSSTTISFLPRARLTRGTLSIP